MGRERVRDLLAFDHDRAAIDGHAGAAERERGASTTFCATGTRFPIQAALEISRAVFQRRAMADDDLAAILAALELPRRVRARWLDDLERFCRAHGGEPHYRELLALVAACRARGR